MRKFSLHDANFLGEDTSDVSNAEPMIRPSVKWQFHLTGPAIIYLKTSIYYQLIKADS